MTCHNTAHHFPRPRFQQLLAPSHLLLKHYAAPSLKSKQAFINGKMYLLLYLYLYFCKESVGLFLHFEIKICLIFSLFNISSGASLFCIQDQTKLISIPRQTLPDSLNTPNNSGPDLIDLSDFPGASFTPTDMPVWCAPIKVPDFNQAVEI